MRHAGRNNRCRFIILAFIVIAFIATTGCVGTGGSAAKHHEETLSKVTEYEYHIPKRPVDRHYIGAPWSKQFGPVENPDTEEIRIKKERSLDSIQQDFAFSAGIGLGGQFMTGPRAEIGTKGGSVDRARLEGVEIIAPVSMADIPFEPGVSYVTEALRLNNFRLKSDTANRAGLNVSANVGVASASATAEIGSRGKTGTAGEGLVVAYKLHTINTKTYSKKESAVQHLPLNNVIAFPEAQTTVTAKLITVEPGTSESLPRNILWACDYAESKSRDIIAAWVVDITSPDPKRRTLSIGFPEYPSFENCRHFRGCIYTAIDPVTDKITREKITIHVIQSKTSDTLQPVAWDASVSLVSESFNIQLVPPPRPPNPEQE